MPLPRDPFPPGLEWLADFPTLLEVADNFFDKEVVPIEEFNAMLQDAKTRAFSAAEAADQVMREKLKDLVQKTVLEGMTAKELRDAAGATLEAPGYADTVYRTNTSTAFQGGIYKEMFSETGPGAEYGYWKFLAVHDSRNDSDEGCPNTICRELDGKVFAKSDEGAMRFLPPQHFGCRCITADVHEDEAPNVTAAGDVGVEPADGWGFDKRDLIPGGWF